MPLLNAYADQLSHIVAEESLQAAERVAVGAGRLRRGTAQQIVSVWQRAAQQRRAVLRPQTREMYDLQMGMAGIAVKREPKADG